MRRSSDGLLLWPVAEVEPGQCGTPSVARQHGELYAKI